MYMTQLTFLVAAYLDRPVSRGFVHPTKPRETNLYPLFLANISANLLPGSTLFCFNGITPNCAYIS